MERSLSIRYSKGDETRSPRDERYSFVFTYLVSYAYKIDFNIPITY